MVRCYVSTVYRYVPTSVDMSLKTTVDRSVKTTVDTLDG